MDDKNHATRAFELELIDRVNTLDEAIDSIHGLHNHILEKGHLTLNESDEASLAMTRFDDAVLLAREEIEIIKLIVGA